MRISNLDRSHLRSDLVGRRFGKIIVTEKTYICEESSYKDKWKCICDCGNIMEKTTLQINSAKSCGCSRYQYADVKESLLSHYYRVHKENARMQNSNPLDRDDWEKIVKSECFYCGDVDKREGKSDRKRKGIIFINGVDRIDSNVGYTKENSVPCCQKCNLMKLHTPKDLFLDRVERIVNHLKLK